MKKVSLLNQVTKGKAQQIKKLEQTGQRIVKSEIELDLLREVAKNQSYSEELIKDYKPDPAVERETITLRKLSQEKQEATKIIEA